MGPAFGARFRPANGADARSVFDPCSIRGLLRLVNLPMNDA